MDKKLTVRSTLQGGLPLYNEEPKDLRSTTCRGQHNGGTEFQTEVYYILIVSPPYSHPTELFYHLECVFHCFPCIAQEQNHRMCKHNYFFLCCCLVSQSCWVLATPWTVTCQAPLSMGLPRQEYWSGLPFPSPRDLPHPGIEPESPALAGGFFTTKSPAKLIFYFFYNIHFLA